MYESNFSGSIVPSIHSPLERGHRSPSQGSEDAPAGVFETSYPLAINHSSPCSLTLFFFSLSKMQIIRIWKCPLLQQH